MMPSAMIKPDIAGRAGTAAGTMGGCAGAVVSCAEISFPAASSPVSAGAGALAGAGLRRGGTGIGPFRLG